MRAQIVAIVVASAAAMTAAGCNRPSVGQPSAGAMGVIDLDEVARRIGSDAQIANAIAQRQSTLTQQLGELAKSYTAQIEQQKAKLGETAEADRHVTLASWEQQANANLNKVKQQAEVDLENHRVQLITQFRGQLKPVVRRVAQARGLSVIVTKNDTVVFDYTSAVDITDAVVDELLAGAPAPAAAAPAASVTTPTTATATAPSSQPQRQ